MDILECPNIFEIGSQFLALYGLELTMQIRLAKTTKRFFHFCLQRCEQTDLYHHAQPMAIVKEKLKQCEELKHAMFKIIKKKERLVRIVNRGSIIYKVCYLTFSQILFYIINNIIYILMLTLDIIQQAQTFCKWYKK